WRRLPGSPDQAPAGECSHPPAPSPDSAGEGENALRGVDFAAMERRKQYAHNIPAARTLRRPMPEAEQLVWEELRDRRFHGLKFRRQHAIDGGIHESA